jgi:hypothetical protein
MKMINKKSTITIDDWLTDIQENGDDGTGHCDALEIVCNYFLAGIAENHNHESEK